MNARTFAFLLLPLVLESCGDSPKAVVTPLLKGTAVKLWQKAAITDAGEWQITDDLLTIESGRPMSGARFEGWAATGLPVTDYQIEFEAQRVSGQDFFAALTFPVSSVTTCATLVLGGWGGALVGISSIDDQDASENSTRSEQHFTNGQWYRIRLRVTHDELKAWIDDRLVVNTSIKSRKISLRPGDIEQCAPFGFATYATEGQVRGLVIRRL